MKIALLLTGKTTESYIKAGFLIFEKRIKHYLPFEIVIIPDIPTSKKQNPVLVKEKEADIQLKYLNENDLLVLLDEKGREFRSVEFATFIQKQMNSSVKNLIFLVGGPYGFSERIYNRANAKISLSKMTFSHQIIRLLFMEQLYRAFSIIRNEPYHHEG